MPLTTYRSSKNRSRIAPPAGPRGPSKRRPPRKPPRRKPPVQDPETKPPVQEPPPAGRSPVREPPDDASSGSLGGVRHTL